MLGLNWCVCVCVLGLYWCYTYLEAEMWGNPLKPCNHIQEVLNPKPQTLNTTEPGVVQDFLDQHWFRNPGAARHPKPQTLNGFRV